MRINIIHHGNVVTHEVCGGFRVADPEDRHDDGPPHGRTREEALLCRVRALLTSSAPESTDLRPIRALVGGDPALALQAAEVVVSACGQTSFAVGPLAQRLMEPASQS